LKSRLFDLTSNWSDI